MTLIVLRGKTGAGKTTLLELVVSTLHFKKIEIDQIKLAKYKTTAECVPEDDFKEAGQIAKELLEKGHDVVVEEAFLDKLHVDYLIQGLQGLRPKIILIRLECSIETAVRRKNSVLTLEQIQFQHLRAVDSILGELVFNTDRITQFEILEALKVKLA